MQGMTFHKKQEVRVVSLTLLQYLERFLSLHVQEIRSLLHYLIHLLGARLQQKEINKLQER